MPLATAAAPKSCWLSELGFTKKLSDVNTIYFAFQCFVRELGLVAVLAVSQAWGSAVPCPPGSARPSLWGAGPLVVSSSVA